MCVFVSVLSMCVLVRFCLCLFVFLCVSEFDLVYDGVRSCICHFVCVCVFVCVSLSHVPDVATHGWGGGVPVPSASPLLSSSLWGILVPWTGGGLATAPCARGPTQRR